MNTTTLRERARILSGPIASHVSEAIRMIEAAEEREAGDAALVEAQKLTLAAVITLYEGKRS